MEEFLLNKKGKTFFFLYPLLFFFKSITVWHIKQCLRLGGKRGGGDAYKTVSIKKLSFWLITTWRRKKLRYLPLNRGAAIYFYLLHVIRKRQFFFFSFTLSKPFSRGERKCASHLKTLLKKRSFCGGWVGGNCEGGGGKGEKNLLNALKSSSGKRSKKY